MIVTMLSTRFVVLLALVSYVASSPRYEPTTKNTTRRATLIEAVDALEEAEYATASYDGESDYIAEYTGLNVGEELNDGNGENITIAEIFGSSDNNEVKKEDDINHDEENAASSLEANLIYKPDVNETISAVEKILADNPTLPRISRTELLDIFENITLAINRNLTTAIVKGYETKITADGVIPSNYTSREEYAKSLMLVLPFNARNMSDERMKELYTKKPYTKMIDNNNKAESTKINYNYDIKSEDFNSLPDYSKIFLTAGPKLVRPTTSDYRETTNEALTTSRPINVQEIEAEEKPANTIKISNQYPPTTQNILNEQKYPINSVQQTLPAVRLINQEQIRVNNNPKQAQALMQNFQHHITTPFYLTRPTQQPSNTVTDNFSTINPSNGQISVNHVPKPVENINQNINHQQSFPPQLQQYPTNHIANTFPTIRPVNGQFQVNNVGLRNPVPTLQPIIQQSTTPFTHTTQFPFNNIANTHSTGPPTFPQNSVNNVQKQVESINQHNLYGSATQNTPTNLNKANNVYSTRPITPNYPQNYVNNVQKPVENINQYNPYGSATQNVPTNFNKTNNIYSTRQAPGNYQVNQQFQQGAKNINGHESVKQNVYIHQNHDSNKTRGTYPTRPTNVNYRANPTPNQGEKLNYNHIYDSAATQNIFIPQFNRLNKTRNDFSTLRPTYNNQYPINQTPNQYDNSKKYNRYESTTQFVLDTQQNRYNKTRSAFPTVRPVTGQYQESYNTRPADSAHQSSNTQYKSTNPNFVKNARFNNTQTSFSTLKPILSKSQYAPQKFYNHGYEATGIFNRSQVPFDNTKEVFIDRVRPNTTQLLKPHTPLSIQGHTVGNRYQSITNANRTTMALKSVTSRPPLIQYQEILPFKPLPTESAIRNAANKNGFNPVANAKRRKNVLGQNYQQNPQVSKTNTNNVNQVATSRLATALPENLQVVYATTKKIRTTTEKPQVRGNINEVLASLGLFPDTNENPGFSFITTKAPAPDISVGAESLSPDMKNMLMSFGLLPSGTKSQQGSKKNTTPNPTLIPKQVFSHVNTGAYSTFQQIPSNKGSKPDQDVSEDMKQFLSSFGLVKQLPQGSKAVEEQIIKFRSQKALNNDQSEANNPLIEKKKGGKLPDINMDMMTNDMRIVLETLGLVGETNGPSEEEEELLILNASEGHIFNPVFRTATLNQTDEAERLSALLDSIKRISGANDTVSPDEKLNNLLETIQLLTKSNETLTQEDIDELNAAINLKPEELEKEVEESKKKPLQKNTKPLDQTVDAPDPLTVDELINLYTKNEVKRQEPNTTETASTEANGAEAISTVADSTVADSTVEVTATSATVTSTTEDDPSEMAATTLSEVTKDTEERNPSLLTDLADSFGGGTVADEVPANIETPPKRPNGLYFLLDWNSFLEVGEDGKNKVNVRLAPKAGNPKNFLPVTIP